LTAVGPCRDFRFSLLAVLLVLAGGARGAEDVPLSKGFGQCIDKSGGSNPAVMECLGAEYTRQDKRLNDAYRKLLARVSKQKGEELRKVQRAWLAYVEAECGFLYDNEAFSGTSDRVEASSCNVTERARRAADLEGILERL
jgi:uncharacterized protein YecT (DUF1311 family)